MKDLIANFFAVLWFFGVMLGTLALSAFTLIGIYSMNIMGMLKSGFSSQTVGFLFCFILGFVIAVTGWVPAFRRCYYKLPWLYPLCTILFMDLFLLSITEFILAKGFSVIDPIRHALTLIIAAIQFVVCRAAMCWYLNKYPMVLHKYDRIE